MSIKCHSGLTLFYFPDIFDEALLNVLAETDLSHFANASGS